MLREYTSARPIGLRPATTLILTVRCVSDRLLVLEAKRQSGILRGKTHLIHDRDPLFTKAFREILRSGGVESVRLPPKSPNLNAYAERFVLSIKSECLDRMVILGERHLRRAIAEYVEHYHLERTHQGLGNRLIDGVPESAVGEVARRERLGGLLNSYYREVA